MSSVVLSGDTSGAITLSAPAVAGTNTITLPASTGTVLTSGSPQSFVVDDLDFRSLDFHDSVVSKPQREVYVDRTEEEEQEQG